MFRWTEMFGRTVLSLAIITGGVVVFALLKPPKMKPRRAKVSKPVQVTTQPALPHTEGISIDVDGVVVPFRQIELAAQVSGKVIFMSVNCQVGRTVKEGELLLRIDADDYDLEVRRLKEELSQADAMTKELGAEIQSSINQIRNAEQQVQIDERQLTRNRDLLSRGAASVSEVDSARRTELAARTSLQSLVDQKNILLQRNIRMESAHALVQANLEKAELDLARTKIVAPFDAVVVEQLAEKDSYVQSGNAIVVLQDTSRLDVACKLQMEEMNWLWQGNEIDDVLQGHDFPKTRATVIYELAGNKFSWDATVDRYDGAGVDSKTRMISCRVHVPEPAAVNFFPAPPTRPGFERREKGQKTGKDQTQGSGTAAAPLMRAMPTLMTGMFVTVNIHTNPPLALLRIPQQAVQPEERVWIVVNGVLVQKDVTVAFSTDDYSVVLKEPRGLAAGDAIVVSPLAQPAVGMRVMADDSSASSFDPGSPNAADPVESTGGS